MLFFRLSSSFFRLGWSLPACWLLFGGWCAVCSVACGWWLGLAVVLALPFPFLLWWLAFVLLRRLLFVRFPRPVAPVSSRGSRWFPVPRSSRWFPLARWCSPRWLCVPASSVSGWLRLVGGSAVRPAVVRRRSGVLLFAWVLVPAVRVRGRWFPLVAPPVGGAPSEKTNKERR